MKNIRMYDRVPDATVEAHFASTKGPVCRLRVGADEGAAQKRKDKSRAKAKAAKAARKAQR